VYSCFPPFLRWKPTVLIPFPSVSIVPVMPFHLPAPFSPPPLWNGELGSSTFKDALKVPWSLFPHGLPILAPFLSPAPLVGPCPRRPVFSPFPIAIQVRLAASFPTRMLVFMVFFWILYNQTPVFFHLRSPRRNATHIVTVSNLPPDARFPWLPSSPYPQHGLLPYCVKCFPASVFYFSHFLYFLIQILHTYLLAL